MTSQWKPVLLSMTLMGSNPALGGNLSHTEVKETGQVTSSMEGNALSASDRARARVWGLSAVEWRRYQHLMQGIRGSVSPSTISPIEVLGIHARDEAERQRYAAAWAQAMREDVDRILAFQRAYNAAGKRLYPNEPLIDIDRLPAKTEETRAFNSTDRLLFFARPACSVCDVMAKKLLKRVDEVSGIDIYLMDIALGDDAAVRDWAAAQQIDLERVRSRQITLNHDGGALDRLTRGRGKAPYLLRRRGEDLSPLQASDL